MRLSLDFKEDNPDRNKNALIFLAMLIGFGFILGVVYTMIMYAIFF